ncbi:hypothetical protein ILYODFUR_033899 [Ilyodon furcidens]|uniref:Uncharacterized protein n=1 Tax=Ilyodon furcidens TaxID=33524 RepID=A0ABV0VA25_9TELE
MFNLVLLTAELRMSTMMKSKELPSFLKEDCCNYEFGRAVKEVLRNLEISLENSLQVEEIRSNCKYAQVWLFKQVNPKSRPQEAKRSLRRTNCRILILLI